MEKRVKQEWSWDGQEK